MKNRFGKMLILSLALCMLIASSVSSSAANETTLQGYWTTVEDFQTVEIPCILSPAVFVTKTDPITGQPRIRMDRTFSNVQVPIADNTYVTVNITVSLLDHSDNASGYEIAAIQTPEYVNQSGFYLVSKDISIASCTYGDGRQTADLILEFRVKHNVSGSWYYVQGETILSLLAGTAHREKAPFPCWADVRCFRGMERQ